MDVFDMAQEFDEQFRLAALSSHFAKTRFQAKKSGLHPSGAGPDPKRLCRDCREEIEATRLAAVPETVRCVDCQSKKEKRESGACRNDRRD